MSTPARDGAAPAYPPLAYTAYVIGVLMLVTLSSQLDRNLTALLVQPIRHDLNLTDTEMSVIHGSAFAIFYAIMGVPFGRMVDHANRRNLIIIGIIAWSVMTALCGLATNFWQLFAARVGVGIGEACLAPAAYSLIADYVAPKSRGRALATYYSALSLGQGASLLLGGLVLVGLRQQAMFELPGLGALAAWQLVFIFAAAPGILLALVLLTVREAPRRGHQGQAAVSEVGERTIAGLIGYFRDNARTFAPVYTAYVLVAFVTLSIGAWAPTYYTRQFGMEVSQVGIAVGGVMAAGGFIGANISGYLSDYFRHRLNMGGRFFVTVIAWSLMLPSLVIWLLADQLTASLVALGVFIAFNAIAASSAPAAIQDLVPNHMRGQAVAIYIMLGGLVGMALAPTMVAMVTDYVFHDDQAIRWSLMAVTVPAAVLGLAASLLGLKPYGATSGRLHAEAPVRVATTD